MAGLAATYWFTRYHIVHEKRSFQRSGTNYRIRSCSMVLITLHGLHDDQRDPTHHNDDCNRDAMKR